MSVNVYTAFGDIHFSSNGGTYPWKEGWLNLYTYQKRLYCAVYLTSFSIDKPRHTYQVKSTTEVAPKSLAVVERGGYVHIYFQYHDLAIRKNSQTTPGSLCKLVELIIKGKRINKTGSVSASTLVPATTTLTRVKVKPDVHKEDISISPSPSSAPAMVSLTKDNVECDVDKKGNGSHKRATMPYKHLDNLSNRSSATMTRAELLNIMENGFFNETEDDLLDELEGFQNRQVRSTQLKDDKKPQIGGFSKPEEQNSQKEKVIMVSENIQNSKSAQSNSSLSTGKPATLNNISEKGTHTHDDSSKATSIYLQEHLSTPVQKPTSVRNFNSSKSSCNRFPLTDKLATSNDTLENRTDALDDFMNVASLYLPEPSPPPVRKPTSVRSFYSSKDCSRFPLTTINTNSLHERPKRRLYNAVPSTRKKQKTSPDVQQEKKLQNGSFGNKRLFSFVEDDENEVQKSKSSDEIGFMNIGNSCYMNSVLQCLLHITFFTEDLRTAYNTIEEQLPELSITRCLMILMSAVQNQKRVKRSILEDMLTTVSKLSPCIKEGEQHDAQEFLCELLSYLDEESKKALGSNQGRFFSVRNNFQFELYSRYECQQCKQKFERNEDFDMLSVDIPQYENKVVTLQTCLEQYFSSQRLEYKCTSCESKDSRCQQKFASVPRVLIIHLKRYSFKEHSLKLDKSVRVPVYLTLKEYTNRGVTVDIPQRKIHRQPIVYDLTKSPRKERRESYSSPLQQRTNSSVGQPSRTFRLNIHDSPFSMRGGQDDFSPIKNGDQEPETSNIEEMSEEEQFKKAIELSRMDFECQEQKELQEVFNRSLQETNAEMVPTDDENEPFQDFRYDALENGPSTHSYQLVSIINHMGRTAGSGHYICNIYNHQKSSWCRFNDETVTVTTINDVLFSSRRTGFLFFYVAREILNAP